MLIADITEYLDSQMHPELQEDYDNAGFLLGDPTLECTGALVALDLTEAVVEEVRRSRSLAALEGCPFLLLRRHDEPGDLSRRLLEEAGLEGEATVLSSNSETLVELALRHVGATFVPHDLAQAMVGTGESHAMCVIDLGPDARIDIHVAWRSSSHVWSVIEDFADLLAEQVAQAEEAQ